MIPSGEQVELSAAGYTAVVTQVGAGLRSLRAHGRPLVREYPADSLTPVSSGVVLAPWPNRIRDGAYSFDGRDHLVPINEHDRGNALHGLVAWSAWDVAERSAERAVLRTRVWPSPAYPTILDLEAEYALGPDGLEWTLRAVNAGDVSAPYGASIHPYVLPGAAGTVDDWTLRLPAARYLDVDPERLLPREVLPVEGTPFDFRAGRAVEDLFVDHAFTEVSFGEDGYARVQVLGADGTGVEVVWDSASPWVQVHTADRPEPELNRTGLAVEPMTCPPDAFNSGTDLVTLAPGAEHAVSWRIRALDGS
ncbi:aldose 1-epimerase family protein [Motilibacter aurantiacus]|uniref:aldose 1-epimerase family protein n=1 Tax=Motilibacter aurantiacus TaxID=2714955 RepID=UPI001409451E|nr:aldose 1-epimerase family protein [Motilibacter aurantiacus]